MVVTYSAMAYSKYSQVAEVEVRMTEDVDIR